MFKSAIKKATDKFSAVNSIYGEMPDRPKHLDFNTDSIDDSFAAGKATLNENNLFLILEEKTLTLPFKSVVPSGKDIRGAIIFLGYDKEIPNKYLPAEEICDRGYAVFSICVSDVSPISGDFKSGIGKFIAGTRKKKYAPGKIALWAWAAARLVEQVCSLDYIDPNRVIICGHGLCARAAMLTAGYCENIDYVIANGLYASPCPCSDKASMTVYEAPYLYSPSFAADPYKDEIEALMTVCAPKKIMIGAAMDGDYFNLSRDIELIKLISEKYYATKKFKGFIYKEIPTAPCTYGEGDISYHARPGRDYLSREDWKCFLDYLDSKSN